MNNELVLEKINCGILKNINLSFKTGTINALVGSIGSGKTTLIKCIGGLLEYEGTITINNHVTEKGTKFNKNIGLYIDNINLTNSTVLDNLKEPLRNLLYSDSTINKKASSISNELGISDLVNRKINELSYSQTKIVSFAKSIIHDPSIILLDNLFDSLDSFFRDRVLKYLEKLKSNNNAIIIFTTSNSEDLIFADNLIILNNGNLVDAGSTKELFKKQKIFNKNTITLPFCIDLSYKLKSYGLISSIIYNSKEVVDKLWK